MPTTRVAGRRGFAAQDRRFNGRTGPVTPAMKELTTTVYLLGTTAKCSLVERSAKTHLANETDLQPRGIVSRLSFDLSGRLQFVVEFPQGSELSPNLLALKELQRHLASWTGDRQRPVERDEFPAVLEFSAGHLLEHEAPLWGPGFRCGDDSHSTGTANLGADQPTIVAACAVALSRLLELADAG